MTKSESNRRYQSLTVDLVERFFISKEKAHDRIPTVFYDIVLHDSNVVIGDIDLRLETNDYQYYYGDVGYGIHKEYRGHHYALDACKIIVEIAKNEYHMKELIFTCNPDNTASYQTLINLGCELIEKVKVPKTHELFWRNEKEKCIFKYTIV